MSNLRKSLIITLSTVFAVILCMTLIFSIRPTYASSVEILDTDGTSIYLSGEGVSYNKTTKKYSVENGSDVTVYIFNEQRIFSNVKVGSDTYYNSTFTLTNVTDDLKFDVYSTSPNPDGSDKGRYFSNPFIIHEDSQLKALEFILSGRTDANELDYYEQFNELGEVTNSNKETARKKLQFGYYVLSENILLDTNEFYGIGSVQYPFAGVFDFRGYHVTLNILNEYKNDYYELDAQSNTSIFSGLFGYVKGLDNKSSMIKDVNVNGKIAFSGTTGNHGFYHYVGGIAGHVEPTTLLAGANSEVSIAIENDTPLFIGGLFGSLKSPLNDQFNFTYKCNYGVLQAKSHGSDVNMSLGALTGILQDTYVYNFEDKSISTHIVANNLGSDNTPHDSGTAVVGGIAGTVYAGANDIHIKNVKMNIAEDKNLSVLIDAPDVGKKAIVGGAFGIIDGSNKVYTEIVPINIKTGSLSIKASNSEAGSYGSIYASGFIGYLASLGHELTYVDKLDVTLLDGNVDIQAINNGYGPAYAGGLFAYRALVIPNTSSDVDDMNKVVINSGKDDSILTIKAEQSQSSRKIYDYSSRSYPLYDVNVGYFCGQTQDVYALNNFEIEVNNAEIQAHRAVGSSAIGDVCAGGFIGKATSDSSVNGYFTNINVNLNNSSVHALSLSYESEYTEIGNNALAGGFVGSIYRYGDPSFNISNTYQVSWNNNSKPGMKNIFVNSNNFGNNVPTYTIRCVQNAKSGESDYKTEGYVGGLVGLFNGSCAENINFNGLNKQSLIYFYGTNNPNTAAAGGLIGNTKNYNQYGINGGSVNNANVIAKGYSEKQTNNSGALTYDIYCGGAIGILASNNENDGLETSTTSVASNIIVTNTVVQVIAESKMCGYAGGIVGGIWWSHGNVLSDSAFVNGTVNASSVTSASFAGGIAGYTNRGHIYNNSAINSYVNANSIDANAGAAGILGFKQMNSEIVRQNYAQCYVSAEGGRYTEPNGSYYYTTKAGIALLLRGYYDGSDDGNIRDNYFDISSFDNLYLGTNQNSNITSFANINTGNRLSNSNLNSNNTYIAFSESGSGNNITRLSSLTLDGIGASANLYVNASVNNGIISSKTGSDRFYLQFTGDTDALTVNKIGNVNNYTNIKAKINSGLVISTVWFNINGLTRNDVTDESKLTAENGWYRFCSYPIKINGGRPSSSNDRIDVSLVDDETLKNISLEYVQDSNGNYVLENGIYYNPTNKYYFYYENGSEVRLVYNNRWYIDSNNNGVYDTNNDKTIYLDSDKVFSVSDDTNIAGYYEYTNSNYNVKYALINMDQSGFTSTSNEHVATSIRVNARLTNTNDLSYKNFPKYGFYDSNIANLTISNPDLDETKWVVPVDYDYSTRIEAILSNSNRSVAYSSNFNGRLSIERDIDNYSIVVTPEMYLKERTILTIEFENKYAKPYVVILEFVPNEVYGLKIVPGEDTPPLETIIETNNNGTPSNLDDDFEEYTYVYVGGDTARFDAFEDKRYTQLSFLASVRYSSSSSAVNANGTVKVPSYSNYLIPVTCELVSGSVPSTTVYIKVLSEISYSITTDGADYASDRKAVQETPFSFEFSAAPGFGSDPDMVRITTNNTTIDLHGSELYYSTTESYTTTINGCIVKFDHHTGTYYVTIPSSIMSSSVTSLSITLKFPVVYSIVFDTGIPNVNVDERYIVFEMEQGSLIDNLFYANTIYPAVFSAIKDERFGFSLHDYYLTDDASTIPRYGETIATMVTPASKVEKDVILYYYFESSDNTEIRVVQDSDSKVWYLDNNLNNILDYTEKTDSNRYNGWRTVTGPYTFYARWTYDIAIEIPDGITISSPLSPDRIINLDANDEDIANGKLKLIPINTNNGFSFTITADASYQGVPRFKLYEVTEGDGTIDYEYKDITEYVSLIAGSNNSYNIPQYDELGHSIINGVIFLKIFNDVIDFEVADIGEFGKVSTNNSIYEDGIFTITYSINYSSVVIDGVEYNNGLPVGHGYTVAENNLSFDFINKDGTDLYLPENTSFRLYRKINDDAYDAGLFINSTPISEIKLSDFINISTGSVMKVSNDLFIENEEYDLVVTLPLNIEGFNEDHKDAKVIVRSTYIESYRQFDYTLTYGYDSNGNLIAVHPESYDVLQSPTRHESFKEKAYDIFNVFDSIPSSGEVTYANGRFLLTFNEGTYVDGVDDHRHSNKYYLWEIAKPNVSLPAGYIVSYNAGKTAEFVSETQNYYYYLATNGNLILANAQENCTIRLLEVDSLSNPAAGIVIYTYPAN